MKKVFAIMMFFGTLIIAGSVPLQAQSIQNTSNDSPYGQQGYTPSISF